MEEAQHNDFPILPVHLRVNIFLSWGASLKSVANFFHVWYVPKAVMTLWRRKKKFPMFCSTDVSLGSLTKSRRRVLLFQVVQSKLRSLSTSIEKRRFLFRFYSILDNSTLFSQARTATGNFPYCRLLLLDALAEKGGALFAELISILWCRASLIARLQTASQSLLHLTCRPEVWLVCSRI